MANFTLASAGRLRNLSLFSATKSPTNYDRLQTLSLRAVNPTRRQGSKTNKAVCRTQWMNFIAMEAAKITKKSETLEDLQHISMITPAKQHVQTWIHTAVKMANPIKQPSNLHWNSRVNIRSSKICNIVHNMSWKPENCKHNCNWYQSNYNPSLFLFWWFVSFFGDVSRYPSFPKLPRHERVENHKN